MRWMWIDSILEYEHGSRMVAIKNVSRAEDHLHDHFAADAQHDALPIMPASLIIEGMAQTAGILVGAANSFREKVILAKIVKAKLDRDVTVGQTIRYEATIDRIDANGAATTGVVARFDHAASDRSWESIGEIDLMFSHVDQNLAGLDFPEENFVFSENFRTILRSAGLESLANS